MFNPAKNNPGLSHYPARVVSVPGSGSTFEVVTMDCVFPGVVKGETLIRNDRVDSSIIAACIDGNLPSVNDVGMIYRSGRNWVFCKCGAITPTTPPGISSETFDAYVDRPASGADMVSATLQGNLPPTDNGSNKGTQLGHSYVTGGGAYDADLIRWGVMAYQINFSEDMDTWRTNNPTAKVFLHLQGMEIYSSSYNDPFGGNDDSPPLRDNYPIKIGSLGLGQLNRRTNLVGAADAVTATLSGFTLGEPSLGDPQPGGQENRYYRDQDLKIDVSASFDRFVTGDIWDQHGQNVKRELTLFIMPDWPHSHVSQTHDTYEILSLKTSVPTAGTVGLSFE